MPNYSAEHDFMVYFLEYPLAQFTDMSGGEVSRTVTTQHPGGFGSPVPIDGPPEVKEITLVKPYDSIVDAPLEAWATAYNQGLKIYLTLAKVPVMSDGAPLPSGKVDTFLECHLVRFKKPDVKRGSAEAAKLEVVVQPSRMI